MCKQWVLIPCLMFKIVFPILLCRSELGKSINTDDAAALGAVYQAAYLGKGFKVKTFHVKEGNMFPINVSNLVASSFPFNQFSVHLKTFI